MITLLAFVALVQQRLLSADQVIRELQTPAGKGSQGPPTLSSDADSLRDRLPLLSPKSVAAAWVGLVSDWEKQNPPRPEGFGTDRSFADVMKALPAPEAWSLIKQDLKALPDPRTASVVAMMDDLLGDNAAVLKYMEAQRKKRAEADDPMSRMQRKDDQSAVPEMRIALRAGDDELLKTLYLANTENFWFDWQERPAILGRLSPAAQREVLRATLEGDHNGYQVFGGPKTRAIAREIALSDLAKMKSPAWDLVDGLDDFAFVSAQVARFGESSLEPSDYARMDYALGLARQGKMDDAVRAFTSGGHRSTWSDWSPPTSDDPDKRRALLGVVSVLLDRELIPDIVTLYSELAPPAEVRERIDRWLSRTDLTPDTRQGLLSMRARLKLFSGQTESAETDLEQGIEATASTAPESAGQLSEKLLNLAVETKSPQLVAFVHQAAPTMGTRGSKLDYYGTYYRMGLIADAQDAALAAMGDTRNVNTSAEGRGRLVEAYPATGVQLAALYYERNEPQQILILLQEYPKWGACDLGAIATQTQSTGYESSETDETLGFYAAWALAETGQKAKAVEVLQFLIPRALFDDAAYELLNRLDSAGAVSLYNELIRENPLARRSRYWKADALLRLGKAKDAEQLLRATIALNPNDATRPYAILARVLEAEGKAAEATTCRKVVESAGLEGAAESADRSDLRAKALGLYQKALELTPGNCGTLVNYSSLLHRMGQEDAARAAYLKAADLALSGEGEAGGQAFTWDFATPWFGPAMETFGRLAKLHPSDPRPLTLMGSLKAYQGDDRGALELYERAAALDANDLEAWHGIVGLAGRGVLSKAQATSAMEAMIRLSPGEYPDEAAISDSGSFAALWRAFDRESRLERALPDGPLYPLPASVRSMKNGSQPAQIAGPWSLRAGAGATLANLPELQTLFP